MRLLDNQTKKKYERYLKILESKNVGTVVIGVYIDRETPIEHQCGSCENVWTTKPSALADKRSTGLCPTCGRQRIGKQLRTKHDDFIKTVDSIDNKLEVLETYITSTTSLRFFHHLCNREFSASPNRINIVQGCPLCAKEKKNKERLAVKEKEFLIKFKELKGNEFDVVGQYTGSKKLIEIRHNLCKKTYFAIPYNIIHANSGCRHCAGFKDTQGFIDQVYEVHREEITVLGEYVNNRVHVRVRHNPCGHEWLKSPKDLLGGSSCPMCRSSNAERFVAELLKDNNISFTTQKTFEKCVHKHRLQFDFYIEDFLLIEFDGIHHFRPTSFSHETKEQQLKNFEMVKVHDNIKNKFAIDNNIMFYRIPYWQSPDIENIVKTILYENKLISHSKEETTSLYEVRSKWNEDKYMQDAIGHDNLNNYRIQLAKKVSNI